MTTVADPVQVQVAQQAIVIVMTENAVDADTSAQLIRDQAAANHLPVTDVTRAILAVAAKRPAALA